MGGKWRPSVKSARKNPAPSGRLKVLVCVLIMSIVLLFITVARMAARKPVNTWNTFTHEGFSGDKGFGRWNGFILQSPPGWTIRVNMKNRHGYEPPPGSLHLKGYYDKFQVNTFSIGQTASGGVACDFGDGPFVPMTHKFTLIEGVKEVHKGNIVWLVVRDRDDKYGNTYAVCEKELDKPQEGYWTTTEIGWISIYTLDRMVLDEVIQMLYRIEILPVPQT